MSGRAWVSTNAGGDIGLRFEVELQRVPPRPYQRDVNPTELLCTAAQNTNKSPDDVTVK